MITVAIVILAIFNFLLGLITFMRNPKKNQNVSFFVFTALIAVWIAANYFENLTKDPAVASMLVRTDFAFGALLAAAFLVFAINVAGLDNKLKYARVLTIAIALSTAVLVYLGLVFKSQVVAGGIKVTDGLLGVLYDPIVVVPLLLGIGLLVYKRARSRGAERQQVSIMLFSLFISVAWVVGANILVPILTSNVAIQTSLQRLAYSGFLIFNIAVSYAIIRHKLFDIRGVVARSLTYILVIATISMAYGLIAFTLVGGALFNNTKLPFAQQTFYAILAVILAFTFQPIRRFFQRVTDKIFYRDKYDPQELINAVGRILTAEIRLNVLTKEVTSVISKQMRVNKVDIVVVNDKNIYYQARVLRSDRSELELKDLQELGKPMLVADDMSTGDRKDIMDKYGLRVSITLRTSEEFVGYLLLGEKLSGDIYNEQDLAVLRIIANELAVAVQNAKAYTEIQQFNKTLQAKVVAATHKLRKANEDLKELDQAKDEFISMASHQLRTPLTTAKGYVSMVLEGDFGKINPQMKEPLTQSLDSANRMAGLVSDLLNVSRMEAGRFFIDTIDVDLNTEVPAEVSQLQTMADAKTVKLVYTKPAKPIPIMKLDLDKTRQVIMNLVDNAIHYSAPPNGGGKVEVSLAQEGTDIIFKVVDNGIGVPLAQQKKLFKKFFRAANAQNTRPDGTGLGLYLVKRVVEDQGGEVVFESKEGKGSTFGFRMPVHNKIKPNSKAAEKLASAEVSSSAKPDAVAKVTVKKADEPKGSKSTK